MSLFSPSAILFYVSIVTGLGIGSYLMYRAGNDRKDWLVVGLGILLSLLTAGLGATGMVGMKFEKMMGYVPAIPALFAAVLLYITRDYYGGEISRYLEIIMVGLLINFAIYVPHLFWHFVGARLGSLPAWGLNPSFWYVFFHGLSAAGFAYISYGFYLFWTSVSG